MTTVGIIVWVLMCVVCMVAVVLAIKELSRDGREAGLSVVAAAADVSVGARTLRNCEQCDGTVRHRAVIRSVSTGHGPEMATVWSCDRHPLPLYGLVLNSNPTSSPAKTRSSDD